MLWAAAAKFCSISRMKLKKEMIDVYAECTLFAKMSRLGDFRREQEPKPPWLVFEED
jgi:hypothetical protein